MASNSPPKDTFTKRPGSTDKGKPYEDLVPALLTLKLTEEVDVKDFQLSANDSEFDAFDDIVLKVFYTNNKSENYAVQLKHLEKNITRDMLGASRGPFSTDKYFLSYQKLKHKYKNYYYVLYTSGVLKVPGGFSFKLTGNNNLEVEIYKTGLKKDFLTSDDTWIYKFQIKNSKNLSENVAEYEEFFKHFLFIPNQKKLEEAENLTKEIFTKAFFGGSDSFDKYLKYIQTWSKIEGKKQCLNKETVVVKLAEILLNPFLRCSSRLISDPYLWLFRDALERFDVIIFESSQLVDDIFSQKEERIRIKETTPLVICLERDHEELIYKVIRFCYLNIPNKKIILFGNGIDRDKLPHGIKIFGNLHNLRNVLKKLYKKLLKTEISIQGRKHVALLSVIQNSKNMEEAFSTTELVQVSKNHLRIGEEKEKLPEPYINQYLLKTLIHISFLGYRTPSLIVISCMNRTDMMEHLNSSSRMITNVAKNREQGFITKLNQSYNNAVVGFEDECTKENFQIICQKNLSRTCHHFRLHSDGNLEWIASQGNIVELLPYRLEPLCIRESDMVNMINNINIICAEPGMGKSVMMKYIKNNLPSNCWLLYVNLRNNLSFFNETNEPRRIFEALLQHQAKIQNYTQFERNVRNAFVKDKRVIVLWDGVDEFTDTAVTVVALKVIHSISKIIQATWITARSYLENTLINKFVIFPLKIKPLDEKQQERYIQDYFGSGVEYVDKIVHKIKKIMYSTKSTGLLGFPLQIRILTELFYYNAEKYNTIDNTFTVTDMIYYFVQESITFHYTSKGYSLNDYFFKQSLKENIQYKTLQYEILALETFLFKEDFDSLPKIAFFGLEKMVKDDFGIVTNITENSVTFLHNTFGEYFVACWFAKNFENVTDFQNFFFKSGYNNIRWMFDIILSEKSPAHLAVLSNNLAGLLKCKDDELDRKDKIGRTPLHVACSHGKAHPLLLVTTSKEYTVELDFQKIFFKSGFNNIGRRMLDVIPSEKSPAHLAGSSNDIDSLLECNNDKLDRRAKSDRSTLHISCSHAKRHLFLLITRNSDEYFIDFEKGESVQADSDEYKKILRFLLNRYDVFEKDNYFSWNCVNYAVNTKSLLPVEMILEKSTDFYGILEKVYDTATLVFYSVRFNYTNLFEIIGTKIPYFESRDGSNLLHQICQWGGRINFLSKILMNKKYLKMINKQNYKKQTILSISGSLISPEQILKTSYETEITKENDNYVMNLVTKATPLHLASLFGDLEIVKILISKGANINSIDNNGSTPLHYATSAAQKEIVGLLITKGANLNKCDYSDFNELNFAVGTGDVELVSYFIQKGSHLRVGEFDKTALNLAVVLNYVEVIEFFLRKCTLSESLIYSAFISAIISNNYKLVDCFITHKKGIYKGSIFGNSSALHVATWLGNLSMVELLINYRSNLEYKDDDGHTPLHDAVRLGYYEVVKLLVLRKANVNATDRYGHNSLHFAAWSGNIGIIKFLLKNGCKINSRNDFKNTPLDLANFNPHVKNAAGFLLAKGAKENERIREVSPELSMALNNLDRLILIKQGGALNNLVFDLHTDWLFKPLPRIIWQQMHVHVNSLYSRKKKVGDHGYRPTTPNIYM